MAEVKKPTVMEMFEDLVSEIQIPGVTFESGFLSNHFYFQVRLSFRDFKGVAFETLGGYYFPEQSHFSERPDMFNLLKYAATEAYRQMVLQNFAVGAHRPFAVFHL